LPKKKAAAEEVQEAEKEKVTKKSNAKSLLKPKRSNAVVAKDLPSSSSGTDDKQVVVEKTLLKRKKAAEKERVQIYDLATKAPYVAKVDKKWLKKNMAKVPVPKTALEKHAEVVAKKPFLKRLALKKTVYMRDMHASAPVDKVSVKAKAEDRPVAPKRPVAGAWGVFLQERREDITKSLPAGHKITDVVKKASEIFKALTDAERKAFSTKFDEKKETYKAAVVGYQEAMMSGGHSLETTPSKKSKMNHITPTKHHWQQSKTMVKVLPELLGPLDADALHEAKGLGYEEAFRSLVSCAALIEKKIPHDKIVRALRAAGGKEKKAFAAIS